MTDATEIPLDLRTYRLIVKTAEKVDNLTDAVGAIKGDVEALKGGVSDLKQDVAICLNQNGEIVDLRADVDLLQNESANLKGKIAIIVILFGTVAGWVGNILPSLVGGKP